MAQDRHPDAALFRAAQPSYYTTDGKPKPLVQNTSMESLATLMGAGWDRNRVQQATREECIR